MINKLGEHLYWFCHSSSTLKVCLIKIKRSLINMVRRYFSNKFERKHIKTFYAKSPFKLSKRSDYSIFQIKNLESEEFLDCIAAESKITSFQIDKLWNFKCRL